MTRPLAKPACPILSSLIGKSGAWSATAQIDLPGDTAILSELIGKGGVRAALFLLTLVALHPAAVVAQAEYAGRGPGSYLALGISASGYNSAYGQQKCLGAALFLDANLFRRVGGELEARSLRYHSADSLRETTVLAGPRFSTHGRTWRPYTKLLAGRGTLDFPFGYAHGSYFVAAPGAGLDLRLGRGRYLLRVVDFEYQLWPGFTFSTAPTGMHPWGISSGISLRLY